LLALDGLSRGLAALFATELLDLHFQLELLLGRLLQLLLNSEEGVLRFEPLLLADRDLRA
jgi:hypothetical protein